MRARRMESSHYGRETWCSEPSLPHFLHPRDYKTHQAVSGPSNRMRDSSETQVICLWRWMVWSGRVHGIIHRDGFFDLRMKLTEDTPLYTIMLHGLHDGQFRVFSNGKMLVSAYRGDSALILATSNATTDVTDERRIPIDSSRCHSCRTSQIAAQDG
jgi:hypothetical protein